MLNTQHWRR
jgi:hypothetical protein